MCVCHCVLHVCVSDLCVCGGVCVREFHMYLDINLHHMVLITDMKSIIYIILRMVRV